MHSELLQRLLTQPEGTTLEFKQELHAIYHNDDKVKVWARHELIKDVLALANGNASSAGASAYLIFGAADELAEDGTRPCFPLSDKKPTRADVLNIVNSACSPPLEDIQCDTVEIGGVVLFVVTIPPSPYVHETVRPLQTGERSSYSKYTVFTRHGESCELASTRDRQAIALAKDHYFRESLKPAPVPYGALLGSVFGGIFSAAAAESLGRPRWERYVYGTTSGVVGGLLGALTGVAYSQVMQFNTKLRWMSPQRRYAVVASTVTGGVASSFGLGLLYNALIQRVKRMLLSGDSRNEH